MNTLILLLGIVSGGLLWYMGMTTLAIAVFFISVLLANILTPQGARTALPSNPFEGLPPPRFTREQAHDMIATGIKELGKRLDKWSKGKKYDKPDKYVASFVDPNSGTRFEFEIPEENAAIWLMVQRHLPYLTSTPEGLAAVTKFMKAIQDHPLSEDEVKQLFEEMGLKKLELNVDEDILGIVNDLETVQQQIRGLVLNLRTKINSIDQSKLDDNSKKQYISQLEDILKFYITPPKISATTLSRAKIQAKTVLGNYESGLDEIENICNELIQKGIREVTQIQNQIQSIKNEIEQKRKEYGEK